MHLSSLIHEMYLGSLIHVIHLIYPSLVYKMGDAVIPATRRKPLPFLRACAIGTKPVLGAKPLAPL